jgi:hypothetical protein
MMIQLKHMNFSVSVCKVSSLCHVKRIPLKHSSQATNIHHKQSIYITDHSLSVRGPVGGGRGWRGTKWMVVAGS